MIPCRSNPRRSWAGGAFGDALGLVGRRGRVRGWRRPAALAVAAAPARELRQRQRGGRHLAAAVLAVVLHGTGTHGRWRRGGLRLAGSVLAAAVAVVAGCGSGTPSRGDVLADLADEMIIPAYQRLSGSAESLEESVSALCAAAAGAGASDAAFSDARSRLDEARAALAEARSAWSFSQPVWVGPVTERRSWAVVDWPVKPDEIESLIAGDDALDFERLSRGIGADQRGLQAVEYALGGALDGNPGSDSSGNDNPDGSDTNNNGSDSSGNDNPDGSDTTNNGSAGSDSDDGAVISGLGDRRRCDYLTGVTEVVAVEAGSLHADWTSSWDGGAAYREEFISSDDMGLDAVVNDSLFMLEAVTDMELGAALGLRSGPADPSAIAEGPAGLGLADVRSHLSGLAAVLVGGGGTAGPAAGDNAQQPEGLSPLLGRELTERLSAQIEEADAALRALRTPLRAALSESPEELGRARDALKALQVTVATEVVSKLGVTIGFSDADGDSAG